MFEWPVRVYYEDTDASGVVYHARYLAFFERARTELLRAAGYSQQQLLDELQIAFTIAKMTIDYRRPARLDDELHIRTQVHARPALVEFHQEMHRDSDGELLATATVKAGCVSTADFRPQRIPSPIVSALEAISS